MTYNNSGRSGAPQILLVYGDVFRDQKWLVKSFRYELSQFHPSYGYYPVQAKGEIKLVLYSEVNIGWDDIRIDGGQARLRSRVY